MTTKTTFTYKSRYVSYPNCTFKIGEYYNGNLALQIVDNEGVIATCTVNGKAVFTNGDIIGVKDYSENEGMVDFLKSMGIIEDTPIYKEISGFVTIPYFKLTESGKELFK
jgi:hypothetical protein